MYNRRSFVRQASTLLMTSAVQVKSNSLFGRVGLAEDWEYQGVAIREADFHVWGASPVVDEQGKVHLFASRWPKAVGVDPGWRSHSEIAHYIAETPVGPFQYVETVLRGSGNETWDRYGIHNPNVHKVGDQYVLLYIANNDYHQPPHPSNQRIGMLTSDSLNGPWKKVNGDGLILSAPENPFAWNYRATNGVNNPSLLLYKGMYLLYFKSANARMGLAIANQVEGPYIPLPNPVTVNEKRIEDGYAFLQGDEVCMLTTDNDGILKKGGGLLWRSADGIHFSSYEPGFHLMSDYLSASQALNPVWHYGAQSLMKFERPQVLLVNGKPAWLYVTSGCNVYGGDATMSYVLRNKNLKSLSVSQSHI